MSVHNTIVCCLQLLIHSEGSKNDFMMAHRELCRVANESFFKICKSVVELSNIAVIFEMCMLKEFILKPF